MRCESRSKRGQRVAGIRCLAGGLACLVLTLAPAGAGDGRVAKVEIGKSAIVWHPVVEYDRLLLAVSGPGVDLRREYGGGQRPSLEVESKAGRLRDGSYSYELQVVPSVSPEARKRLAEAREAMDRGKRVDLTEIQESLGGPFTQSGSFSVREGAFVPPGEPEPVREQRQTGDLQVEGSLKVAGAKSFVAADPRDADRQLVYAALEGPEAGTYHRGSARTVGGEAVIELPGHFAAVTEREGLTVQLTPAGRWSRLYVAERSPERLVVRSADADEVEFDYLVQGVRKGWAGFEVERPAGGAAAADDSGEER